MCCSASTLPWRHELVPAKTPATSAAPTLQDAPGSSGQAHRLLVEIPPLDLEGRASDQMPALVPLDFFSRYGRSPDFSTLTVQEFGSGKPVPWRWYDAEIPWMMPEVPLPISRTGNQPRSSETYGLGYHYMIDGDGKRGSLGLLHKQSGDRPSYYIVSFDLLDAGKSGIEPRGWLGDGQIRSMESSTITFSSSHVRNDVYDYNGDGLTDIIVGEHYGQLLWMPNMGTAEEPHFDSARYVLDENGLPIDAGMHSSPVMTDWDGDGLADMLVGNYVNRISFYKNVGTRQEPRFAFVEVLRIDGDPIELPIRPIIGRNEEAFKMDYYPVLEVIDYDQDGDDDLIAGGYVTGRFYVYENVGATSDGTPELQLAGNLVDEDNEPINVGDWAAAPGLGDLNGDGLPDLVTGSMPMTAESRKNVEPLNYYVNTGTAREWQFSKRKMPMSNPLKAYALGTPRMADMDSDGDLDLVVGTGFNVWYYENTGTRTEPLFVQPPGPISRSWGPSILPFDYFIDYNRDGLPDGVKGYTVYLNSGAESPFGFKRTNIALGGAKIRHDSGKGDDWFWPRLYDFDGDGDFDILFGDWNGTVWLHRNNPDGYDETGVQLAQEDGSLIQVGPLRASRKGDDFNKLQGARTVLVAGDFNEDGLTDIVVGDNYGDIYYAKNITSNEQPSYAPLVQIGDIGTRMMLDSGDWDGDGRLDVVAGSANNRTLVFLNRGKDVENPFLNGESLELPPLQQPRLLLVDLNGDGDLDIFSPSKMGSAWIERSFIRNNGYVEGSVIDSDE